jgi:hypothetical protein
MVVTYVMVTFCVVGVIGALASVLSYDKHYSENGSPMRIARHPRRSVPRRRPSSQLQAIEAALARDSAADQPDHALRARRVHLRGSRRRPK